MANIIRVEFQVVTYFDDNTSKVGVVLASDGTVNANLIPTKNEPTTFDGQSVLYTDPATGNVNIINGIASPATAGSINTTPI